MSMDDRKQAQENKFAHDEEFKFKLTARRNKLFGLWLAAQMGKDSATAEAYAKEVVLADMDSPGEDDLFAKVEADLAAAGKSIARAALEQQLANLTIEAKNQLMAG